MKRQPPRIQSTDARLKRYEERLNAGYELIEKRRMAGLDVSKLEAFWMELLHEYEALCESEASS